MHHQDKGVNSESAIMRRLTQFHRETTTCVAICQKRRKIASNISVAS